MEIKYLGVTERTKTMTQGHTHQRCKDNFPNFVDKDHWPPNSPDLNPLDYYTWDEFVQQTNWDKIQSKKILN